MLLTIGQLAEHCGVTVRAVRHYHQVGLLPEADRDASGYRRYGAAAVIQLIRIKVLAEAGVPLARISQLIEAGPAEFAAQVDGIDQALEHQITRLQHRRRQLAGLVAGDRLVLPAAVAELLGELCSMGASDRAVGLERDGWILIEVLAPELVAEWVKQKRAALADPELRSLYLAVDEAWTFEPDDPRIERLADRMAAWAKDHSAMTPAMRLPRYGRGWLCSAS